MLKTAKALLITLINSTHQFDSADFGQDTAYDLKLYHPFYGDPLFFDQANDDDQIQKSFPSTDAGTLLYLGGDLFYLKDFLDPPSKVRYLQSCGGKI
jgi:hypothetical protein